MTSIPFGRGFRRKRRILRRIVVLPFGADDGEFVAAIDACEAVACSMMVVPAGTLVSDSGDCCAAGPAIGVLCPTVLKATFSVTWTQPLRPVVVCEPVGCAPRVLRGSELASCRFCGCPVWVMSEAAQECMRLGGEAECLECAWGRSKG